MPKLWIQGRQDQIMPWGAHSLAVTKQRPGHVIRVSEALFDALKRAAITGPEGREDRLSVAQYRNLIEGMSKDEIARTRVSLTAAFLAPPEM